MDRRGTALCLASGAAFGAMAIFGKLAYDEGVNVATLLCVRFSLAAALFWAIAIASGAARDLRRLPRSDRRTGLALGAIGYATQAGLFFAALERIDASLLSLVLYTFPAMVAIAAVLLGRDRLDTARISALVLASTGLVLVLVAAGAGSFDVLGVGLALCAALVYTTYILVSQPVAGRMRPELLSALVCSGATVPLVVGALALGQLDLGAVQPAGWAWLVGLTVVSTVAAVSFFFAGLRRVGPTAASILATVEPVVTVVLAFVVFGERLAAAQVVGALLVLSAVPALNAGGLRSVRRSRMAHAEGRG